MPPIHSRLDKQIYRNDNAKSNDKMTNANDTQHRLYVIEYSKPIGFHFI